jgi:hypothetical protein
MRKLFVSLKATLSGMVRCVVSSEDLRMADQHAAKA